MSLSRSLLSALLPALGGLLPLLPLGLLAALLPLRRLLALRALLAVCLVEAPVERVLLHIHDLFELPLEVVEH